MLTQDEIGKYKLANIYSVGDTLESDVLNGFRIEINKVLPRLEQ